MTVRALLLSCLLFLASPCLAESTSSPYYVPPQQFNAELQLMDLGFSNVFVLFQNGTASFSFDETAKSIHRLRIALDATSLVANNAGNQRDVAQLLDTSQYSEIDITAPDAVTFTDGKAEIKGTATLHGISKPVVLLATLNHIGKSPRGGGMWSSEGDAVGLSLHTTLKRSDFGMGDDPKAELPGRFGDPLNLTVEMQAIRQ